MQMRRTPTTHTPAKVPIWMAWGALLATLGCSKSTNESLVIFAASSLTDGFQELATSFEETYPQIPVQLSFAGSQTLRLQLSKVRRQI